MKKKIKKLQLCKETLRTLENQEMHKVQGGTFSDVMYFNSCIPNCNVDSDPCLG